MKKWLLRFAIGLLFIALLIISLIIYWSPQRTEDFRNSSGQIIENSIASIENIEINGISQRIVIRGQNINNPILLHVHGGPGAPDRAAIKLLNTHVEDLFTVVYWDQRGTGGSYHSDMSEELMTLDQISKDGIVLSEYLLERFAKEKLYLQGHSWGTTVGVAMAEMNPDLFHAYIGIGQMANSEMSELASYHYTLEAAKEADNKPDVARLEEMGPPPYAADKWANNVMIERQILWKYENPHHENQQSMTQIYLMYIMHPEYSIADKLGILLGSKFSMTHLWNEAMNINHIKNIPELEIPVYFMQGKYDMHTATPIAKIYFDNLTAPEKHYFEFERSAHAPHFEEYGKYKKIMKKEMLGR